MKWNGGMPVGVSGVVQVALGVRGRRGAGWAVLVVWLVGMWCHAGVCGEGGGGLLTDSVRALARPTIASLVREGAVRATDPSASWGHTLQTCLLR